MISSLTKCRVLTFWKRKQDVPILTKARPIVTAGFSSSLWMEQGTSACQNRNALGKEAGC